MFCIAIGFAGALFATLKAYSLGGDSALTAFGIGGGSLLALYGGVAQQARTEYRTRAKGAEKLRRTLERIYASPEVATAAAATANPPEPWPRAIEPDGEREDLRAIACLGSGIFCAAIAIGVAMHAGTLDFWTSAGLTVGCLLVLTGCLLQYLTDRELKRARAARARRRAAAKPAAAATGSPAPPATHTAAPGGGGRGVEDGAPADAAAALAAEAPAVGAPATP